MPVAIRILLLALAVLAGIGAAAIQAEDTPCATAAKCNTRGTQAYRQGSYPQALDAFAWQLRLAERQEQGGADSEQALNNLALTSLKAGQPGRARAWMNLALDRGYSGKATRYNLEQVALKVDYPSLQGLAGHYLRYAGQAEWESLQIEPVKGGYQASFALMRIGNPEKLMEYGPAAVGELSGRLEGQGALYRLRSEGLGAGCSLLVWQEGIDLRVVESLGGNCQGYGGMGIAAAGNWVKISSQARDD
ncbi:TPA: hypothetical protein SL824_001646 [Pseudomonas aeruginosa]|uniref:hypothetical protein n=1 Tax=Pseudomonas aeruginosa TaxID=287 RepID=UPI0007446384|nr:hypothetical protein [Pseudomonas aeruginosa]ALY58491.1 hypothetical protein HW06_05280 [Pseudomonas aeruginosa]MCS7784307.1 hypothetical protein [Pseudomonas aeruginosa]RPZ70922.1 hypothetical protein IPC543_18955 [Pseudomonas aeruginosa]RUH12318.1 hypothetical protein IPC542_21945 [Pseudomonas aeruginosa]RUH47289.1 hypothetical protein IPC541_21235 [Pseudomonas aeruginosa]